MVRMCSDNRQGDNRLRSRVIASRSARPVGRICLRQLRLLSSYGHAHAGPADVPDRNGPDAGPVSLPSPGGGWCDLGDDGCLEILHLGNAFFSSTTANSLCQLIDKRDGSRADAFQIFWRTFLRLP